MSCGRLEHVEVWSRQMGRTLIILVFDRIVFCFKAGLTFSLVIVDMCVDLPLAIFSVFQGYYEASPKEGGGCFEIKIKLPFCYIQSST